MLVDKRLVQLGHLVAAPSKVVDHLAGRGMGLTGRQGQERHAGGGRRRVEFAPADLAIMDLANKLFEVGFL